MKLFKEFFKNRAIGFWIALSSAILAIIIFFIYLIGYLSIANEQMDRVFSLLTLFPLLAGGLLILVGELFKVDYLSILGTICFAVSLSKHSVEAAYPIADIGTGVVFFGGNQTFAILFIILIGLTFVISVVSNFLEHNKLQ